MKFEGEFMNAVTGITGDQLKSFVERIERLEEEKAGLAEDIREIFAESKSQGYDPKIMREVLKIRKMNKEDREVQEELITVYLNALGM